MKAILIALSLLAAFTPAALRAAPTETLESGFTNIPAQTQPWCYYYWISDNISKAGITKDLEAMKRVGIGEALIGNIFLDNQPVGRIKVLSEEWWGLIEHAIREGGRIGVNIGLFNCPGWSQSGGPWIKPEQTMRYAISSEMRVTGPKYFSEKLAAPKEPFQDIAVLAFPAPQNDSEALALKSPRITVTPAVAGAEKLADGDLATSVQFPADVSGPKKAPFTVDIELAAPLTARTLQIFPTDEGFGAEAELSAQDDAGQFQTVRKFKCDRSNPAIGTGFMPRGPVTVSIPATTSRHFRLVFSSYFGRGNKAQLAEINLSGAARVESYIEKQLAKMHPTPLPLWDTYMWATPAEPDSAKLAVPVSEVKNLSANLAADGMLTWDVPAGEWIIQRTGMTPTGMRNGPASPEGQGLEVDKMNRELAQKHFDAFIGQLLKRMPASERKAFKQVVADSYEMGSQNWTDGMAESFRKQYGYDPKPWLPVLSGRIIGSVTQSDRFLWDLRRLVADRVATDYVGGLRAAANANGLGLWLENYGHWGFPGEFLKYGSQSDRIGGEFWVTGDLGSIECRAASSCANTYGKQFVSAESFTGGPAFQNAPGALKARGDWSFCEGINHVVLHVYIQQPSDEKIPGINAPWGTEFNRHNTWFEDGAKAWINYERRCCWLLQQGWRVADVAYFIGEDAPKMTGGRNPELPPGRDFDYINAEVIEKNLSVKNGDLVLPHGVSYRVLVLPKQTTMRPEVLRKIRDLVKSGATVVGEPPSSSPSMENFPKCDAQVQQLAAEIWGGNLAASGERKFGQGRIIWGKPLGEVLGALGSGPDFQSAAKLRFTHRHSDGTDIYFVANPKTETVATTAAFRAGDRVPELWWPDSGRIERPAVYEVADGVVRLPLFFEPEGSVFVVFREKAAPKSERIVSVTRDGKEVLGTTVKPPASEVVSDSPNNFTFAVWVKPADDTTLVREANTGIVGMAENRNDVFAAPHGDGFGGGNNAGSGLSVGRNGVSVFEHGASYFVPTLVCAALLTNWTHVAVVYREGQPSLYLNGVLARTGLKSTHIVHSGAGQGGAKYRGKLGGIEQFSRALSPAEIAQLPTTMRQPDDYGSELPLQLTRTATGRIAAHGGQAGDCELNFADGQTRPLKVSPVPAPVELTAPWEVSFAPGWGAPEKVTFNQLTDWTTSSEEGIKYYSGAATYRTTFELPALGNGLMLDLGKVCDLATVRLNGQALGTVWTAPWRVDISQAAKVGKNALEITVVNPWNNRLVGDAKLPAEQRRTSLSLQTVKADAPLQSAGLLGPVTVQAVAVE